MATLIIQSKTKQTNLDGISNKDAFARVMLTKFDILNYSYTIQYAYLQEYADEDGNPLTANRILKTSVGEFLKEEVQALFDATGKDIAVGENFDNEMRDIIATAVIYKVDQDDYFGLTSSDWEVIA